MKLFLILLLSVGLFAETINVKDSRINLDFKILCINGNQYLYLVGSNSNPTQMFKKLKYSNVSIPIECNGYEDEK